MNKRNECNNWDEIHNGVANDPDVEIVRMA